MIEENGKLVRGDGRNGSSIALGTDEFDRAHDPFQTHPGRILRVERVAERVRGAPNESPHEPLGQSGREGPSGGKQFWGVECARESARRSRDGHDRLPGRSRRVHQSAGGIRRQLGPSTSAGSEGVDVAATQEKKRLIGDEHELERGSKPEGGRRRSPLSRARSAGAKAFAQ
jgi:hypothetical protein